MGRTSDAKEKLTEAAWELIWAGSYGTTSVDDICARAGVLKGSFYHFFESKAELATAGLDQAWTRHLAELDHHFSPIHRPLDRLRRFCDYIISDQRECAAKHGRVLGCPVHSLGAEVSTWEELLQAKIREAISHHQQYLESALRDGVRSGEVSPHPDPGVRARLISATIEGLLLHARIRNDISVLDELTAGVLMIATMPGPA